MRHRPRTLLLLSSLAIAASAPNAAAQAMGAHAMLFGLGPEELGRPIGFGITLEQPIGKRGVRWHLSFDAGQVSLARTGSPCSGLVPIGEPTCAVQPLRTHTDMESAVVGVRLPLIHARRVSLSLVGDIGASRVATKTRDTTDATRLSAWRMMYRPEAGVEARVKPRKRKNFWISAGAAMGQVRPFTQNSTLDGYAPFDAPLRLRRAWLGLMFDIDPAVATRRR